MTSRWHVLVTGAGLTAHGWSLPLDVLHASVQSINGTAVWLGAKADHNVDRTDSKCLAGYLTDAQPHPEGIAATLVLMGWQTWLRDDLEAHATYWRERGEFQHALGLSVVLPGDGHTFVPLCAAEPFVASISRIDSVDLVLQPATSARFLGPLPDDKEQPVATETEDLTPQQRADFAATIIARSYADEAALERQRDTLQASVRAVRHTAGDAYVLALRAGEHDAGAALQRVRDVESEIDIVDDAITTVRAERQAARQIQRQAQAEIARAAADDARVELGAYLTRERELLAALREHTGTDWTPQAALDLAHRQLGAHVEQPAPAPRGEALRERVAQLDQQHRELAGPARPVVMRQHASTADELVNVVRHGGGETTPTRSALQAWLNDVDPQRQATRYDLVWRDETILTRESSATFPAKRAA